MVSESTNSDWYVERWERGVSGKVIEGHITLLVACENAPSSHGARGVSIMAHGFAELGVRQMVPRLCVVYSCLLPTPWALVPWEELFAMGGAPRSTSTPVFAPSARVTGEGAVAGGGGSRSPFEADIGDREEGEN